MESDDVSNSEDNWEVLESLGVHDDRSPLTLGEGSIDNLERANVERLVDLVWEGSINDDSVNVHLLGGLERALGDVSVLVLLSLGFLGNGLWWGLGLLG